MPFLNDALQKGKETEWHATWIHPDFIGRDGVHYFWFLKQFDLEELPQKASIDITADQKYMPVSYTHLTLPTTSRV